MICTPCPRFAGVEPSPRHGFFPVQAGLPPQPVLFSTGHWLGRFDICWDYLLCCFPIISRKETTRNIFLFFPTMVPVSTQARLLDGSFLLFCEKSQYTIYFSVPFHGLFPSPVRINFHCVTGHYHNPTVLSQPAAFFQLSLHQHVHFFPAAQRGGWMVTYFSLSGVKKGREMGQKFVKIGSKKVVQNILRVKNR